MKTNLSQYFKDQYDREKESAISSAKEAIADLTRIIESLQQSQPTAGNGYYGAVWHMRESIIKMETLAQSYSTARYSEKSIQA